MIAALVVAVTEYCGGPVSSPLTLQFYIRNSVSAQLIPLVRFHFCVSDKRVSAFALQLSLNNTDGITFNSDLR